MGSVPRGRRLTILTLATSTYRSEDGETEADPMDPRLDTGGSSCTARPHRLSRKTGALQKGGTLQALKAVKLPEATTPISSIRASASAPSGSTSIPKARLKTHSAKEALRFQSARGSALSPDGALVLRHQRSASNASTRSSATSRLRTPSMLLIEGGDSAGDSGARGRLRAGLHPAGSARTTSPSPSGDVIVAEDSDGVNRLIGFTPRARARPGPARMIAYPDPEEEGCRKSAFHSEVAGPTFSPDGQILSSTSPGTGRDLCRLGTIPAMSVRRQRHMSSPRRRGH